MRQIYLLFTLCSAISFVNTANLPDLYWNSSNPLFDDTELEPAEIRPRIMDAITIHCPFYHNNVPLYATQQMKIYRVSEEAYEKCYLDAEAKEVALCQTPFQRNHIRIVFREFSPLPGALEYAKRQSYYFISTSDGSSNGINKTHGGLCARHNMRLRVHVHMRDHPIRHHGHGHGSLHRPKKPFEYNADKELPAPALPSTVAPSTPSPELPFWNEFLSKLSGESQKPTQTRPNIGYWPHPRNTHSNSIAETVELDGNSPSKSGLEYDRGQSMFNEPEALNDPNYKLFEIHEIDELMSASATFSLCWLLSLWVAFVLLR
uniref:Ephrin RBD domain-containing protein n=1 Tax=Steinernema glaseri TaxID=37863 RepID=A0A1I7Z4R8_9BILA